MTVPTSSATLVSVRTPSPRAIGGRVVLEVPTPGLEAATEQPRHWPAGVGLPAFFVDRRRHGALPATDTAILDLIRMTHTEPALRAAWLQAHDDALPVIAELLAEGLPY